MLVESCGIMGVDKRWGRREGVFYCMGDGLTL